jgi:hypothetical protein
MVSTPGKILSAKVCREQAAECKKLSKQTMTPSQKIMLEHIADTWLRVSAEIDKTNQ